MLSEICMKQSSSLRKRKSSGSERPRKLREVMAIADSEGLLQGERTRIIRGRMPEALVRRAKKRTGIHSDTDLIEVALANIAVEDDYVDWLLSRRGVIDPEVDLGF